MEYDDRLVREDWKLNKQYQFDVRVRIRTPIGRKYLFGRGFTKGDKSILEAFASFFMLKNSIDEAKSVG